MSFKGTHKGPRVPVQPLSDWLALRPRALPENEMRILCYARKVGTIDVFMADRIFCMCGRPEMLSILYGEEPVAA
jgi:hypothetical protein